MGGRKERRKGERRTSSRSSRRLTSIQSVMPSSHLTLCRPLLLLPSVFPSIRVFSNESVLRIRCPKYWSFSISPPSEYPGLIFFRMDWLNLLVVQGTLKILLQHHTYSYTYTYIHSFFKESFLHIGHCRVLSRVPCTIQQVLISYTYKTINFICS